jgi:hypothetical protein
MASPPICWPGNAGVAHLRTTHRSFPSCAKRNCDGYGSCR